MLWWGWGLTCIFVFRAQSRQLPWDWETLLLKLNSFAKIGNSSGTTTWILSGSVAFVESRILITLEISKANIKISQSLYSVRWENPGKKGSLLSNLELRGKVYSKELSTLQWGPFIMVNWWFAFCWLLLLQFSRTCRTQVFSFRLWLGLFT